MTMRMPVREVRAYSVSKDSTQVRWVIVRADGREWHCEHDVDGRRVTDDSLRGLRSWAVRTLRQAFLESGGGELVEPARLGGSHCSIFDGRPGKSG